MGGDRSTKIVDAMRLKHKGKKKKYSKQVTSLDSMVAKFLASAGASVAVASFVNPFKIVFCLLEMKCKCTKNHDPGNGAFSNFNIIVFLTHHINALFGTFISKSIGLNVHDVTPVGKSLHVVVEVAEKRRTYLAGAVANVKNHNGHPMTISMVSHAKSREKLSNVG